MVARSALYHSTRNQQIGLEPAETKASNTAWLIIFTDLVSLMLTFFVMLFAMSNVKLDEWKNITDSLSQTLRPAPEQQVKAVTATFNIGTIFRKQAIDLDYLSSILEENISKTDALAGTRVTLMEDQLIISLPGDLLFRPGQAVLDGVAQEALFVLGGVFQNIGNQIGVNGHSDPSPPPGEAYASNWELTTGRAASVANALRRAGYQDKIVALGFADSKFLGLPETQNSLSMARRIEIVILPTVRLDD